MHRTEHCNLERCALRLSAPRKPFSPAPGLTLQSTPLAASWLEPETRDDLSLSRNGCRFSRPPFRGQRSRPATSLRHHPIPQPVRPFRSTTSCPVRPGEGCFSASSPLLLPRLAQSTARPASTPRQGSYTPTDQSVQQDRLSTGSPSELARFPFAPRCRFLSLVFRLRINVPGPLRFRRLAVPQTSWNLPHYALDRSFGQCFS